jgi:hypothetical protein
MSKPMTDAQLAGIQALDLLALMPEKSAGIVSGHLAALLAEVRRLKRSVSELEKDSATLAALEAHGVDNWEGYSDALAGED